MAPAVQLLVEAIEVTGVLEDGHANHTETGFGAPNVGATLAIGAIAALACGFCQCRLTHWIRMGPLRHAR